MNPDKENYVQGPQKVCAKKEPLIVYDLFGKFASICLKEVTVLLSNAIIARERKICHLLEGRKDFRRLLSFTLSLDFLPHLRTGDPDKSAKTFSSS